MGARKEQGSRRGAQASLADGAASAEPSSRGGRDPSRGESTRQLQASRDKQGARDTSSTTRGAAEATSAARSSRGAHDATRNGLDTIPRAAAPRDAALREETRTARISHSVAAATRRGVAGDRATSRGDRAARGSQRGAAPHNAAQRATRTEKDSLGEREVPADAYFGIQTQRALENFPISGLRAHRELIRAIGMIKQATAEANRELGLLAPKLAAAIIDAAREVQSGALDDQFRVDVYQAGAGVSFHMNANEVIANRAIEILGGARGDYSVVHPNDHVNFGQSTNDVFPTAMRLAAILLFDQLKISVAALTAAFSR
jgi:hypothetical protein